jgi:hypothetical protein
MSSWISCACGRDVGVPSAVQVHSVVQECEGVESSLVGLLACGRWGAARVEGTTEPRGSCERGDDGTYPRGGFCARPECSDPGDARRYGTCRGPNHRRSSAGHSWVRSAETRDSRHRAHDRTRHSNSKAHITMSEGLSRHAAWPDLPFGRSPVGECSLHSPVSARARWMSTYSAFCRCQRSEGGEYPD